MGTQQRRHRAAEGVAPALGRVRVVSLGPGSPALLTAAARDALAACQVVVGYTGYLEHVRDLLEGKRVLAFGMGEEQARVETAVRLAQEGATVALVSGGDAGVYGMAGLLFEHLVAQGWSAGRGVAVEVVPGVTAAVAAAALVGAPLAADFAVVSLSDRYVPWEVVLRRVEAVAWADMVLVLYEPASRHRPRHIAEAQAVIARHRQLETPVAVVRDAYRPGQEVALTTLGEMLACPMDMRTVVIVGNSTTRAHGGVLVTPRRYPG